MPRASAALPARFWRKPTLVSPLWEKARVRVSRAQARLRRRRNLAQTYPCKPINGVGFEVRDDNRPSPLRRRRSRFGQQPDAAAPSQKYAAPASAGGRSSSMLHGSPRPSRRMTIIAPRSRFAEALIAIPQSGFGTAWSGRIRRRATRGGAGGRRRIRPRSSGRR